jgi:hypothetical protein
MIRDPSDGSVKEEIRDGLNRQARNPAGLPDGNGGPASAGLSARGDITDHRRQVGTPREYTSANNWGLTTLDKPERKPVPAPTREELAEHYRKFGLRFQPKEREE